MSLEKYTDKLQKTKGVRQIKIKVWTYNSVSKNEQISLQHLLNKVQVRQFRKLPLFIEIGKVWMQADRNTHCFSSSFIQFSIFH